MGGWQFPVDQARRQYGGLSLKQDRELASPGGWIRTEAEFERVTGEVEIERVGGDSGRKLAEHVNGSSRQRGGRSYGQGQRLDVGPLQILRVGVIGHIHLPAGQQHRPGIAAINLLSGIGIEHGAVAECLSSIVGNEGGQLPGKSRSVGRLDAGNLDSLAARAE